MKKVQILLSTYNGEKYIREQLDSIINQNYKKIDILIRDDGSTDGTVAILNEYKNKYNSIELILENNIGVVASFLKLIKSADMSADIFCFCDQDDVWLNNNVSAAVDKLSGHEDEPTLYFSRLTLTDEHLNIIKETTAPQFIGPENAIVQNIVSGCALAVNKKLMKLCIDNLPDVTNVYMHDWWFYLLASFMGEIVFDDNAYILHRQHGGNETGRPLDYWSKRKFQLKYILNKTGQKKRINHINEFQKSFNNYLQPEHLQLFDTFFKLQHGLINRIKIAMHNPFRFKNKTSTRLLSLMILFNVY